MENKNKKFKPFDRVLVKAGTAKRWECDLYSHYKDDDEFPHRTLGYHMKDENIVPYEGNEHLVGTSDELEVEIKLEDEYMFGITFDEALKPNLDGVIILGKIKGLTKSFDMEYFDFGDFNKKYAIRFCDFNPYNMEETRKHILCVKNGKVVRYRE